MGFWGLNGVTAPKNGWGWLGEEGGRMLSRYSHWLSRPSLKMGGGYWLSNDIYNHRTILGKTRMSGVRWVVMLGGRGSSMSNPPNMTSGWRWNFSIRTRACAGTQKKCQKGPKKCHFYIQSDCKTVFRG